MNAAQRAAKAERDQELAAELNQSTLTSLFEAATEIVAHGDAPGSPSVARARDAAADFLTAWFERKLPTLGMPTLGMPTP